MSHALILGGSLSQPSHVKAWAHTVLPRRNTAAFTTWAQSPSVQHVDTVCNSDDMIQDGPVRYGIVTAQGPRETMEDVAYVVENGPCGFLFASTWYYSYYLYLYIDCGESGSLSREISSCCSVLSLWSL